jgi:ATP-binding cassette subfamily F protein 3
VQAGDRICIIGPNGRGKTTLLKLLAGTLTPNQGVINESPNVVKGVYEQTNVQHLKETLTVEEEVLGAHPDIDRQRSRNICGAMMFSGDDALKKISILSGGEKCRVMLGKILATPVNLLMLDEPSNHLDMDSCDALLAAVDAFDGTVLMVTHNEMFLHAVARRLIVFQESGVEVFEGTYQDFLDRRGWQTEDLPTGRKKPKTPMSRAEKKERKRQRSEITREKSKALKPLRHKIELAEMQIENLETELADMNKELIEASERQDAERIATLSKATHGHQEKIAEAYEELEHLSEEHDAVEVQFAHKLQELDAAAEG